MMFRLLLCYCKSVTSLTRKIECVMFLGASLIVCLLTIQSFFASLILFGSSVFFFLALGQGFRFITLINSS